MGGAFNAPRRSFLHSAQEMALSEGELDDQVKMYEPCSPLEKHEKPLADVTAFLTM